MDDSYSLRRKEDCKALFEGFSPDLSGCRKKEMVLQIFEMARAGLFSHEIAERLGVTPKAVQKVYRRYSFPTLQNYSPPKREERIGWKGGEKIVKGYLYRRSPGHPLASKHGDYVAVHRLVVEQSLGRFLTSQEVVDHIDGDTMNNSLENLRVFESNAEHLKATLKGKCPQWSQEGKDRLAASRRQVRRTWKGVSREPTREE